MTSESKGYRFLQNKNGVQYQSNRMLFSTDADINTDETQYSGECLRGEGRKSSNSENNPSAILAKISPKSKRRSTDSKLKIGTVPSAKKSDPIPSDPIEEASDDEPALAVVIELRKSKGAYSRMHNALPLFQANAAYLADRAIATELDVHP